MTENERLNRLECYRDLACARCGRSWPETVLNIEARIHHGAHDYECVDRRACRRVTRKRKR